YFSNIAEFYSLYIYPVFASFFSFIFSFSSSSIGCWIVFFLPLIILSLLIYFFILIIKKKEKKKIVINGLKIFSIILSIIYISFTLLCGINYNRIPFSQNTPYKLSTYSKEDLINTTKAVTENLNIYAQKVKRDDNNIMVLSNSLEKTSQMANEYISNLEGDYNVIKNYYSYPKKVFFSKALSYLNITGIYFPFTVEANFNSDIVKYQLPVTMCHEKAHQIGFMPEQEANFIAYLACINSQNDDFIYSANMLAFVYLSNAVFKEDENLYFEIKSSLNENVIKDFVENNNYWKNFETPISEISENVNNTYLKANNQTQGIKSYGMVCDLLIAKYKYDNAIK
ncbi:MAG: DUF3810 domain-containing protein, partial [Oscillospiraceae bacterium]